jgi:hypothetical protein
MTKKAIPAAEAAFLNDVFQVFKKHPEMEEKFAIWKKTHLNQLLAKKLPGQVAHEVFDGSRIVISLVNETEVPESPYCCANCSIGCCVYGLC